MTHMKPFAVSLAVVALAGTTPALAGDLFGTDPAALSICQPTPQVDGGLGLDVDESYATTGDCCDLSYCGPRWTVGAGAVIKKRNRCFMKPLVRGVAPDSYMDTNDLDPGWGAGPWVKIIRHFDSGLDFEVEYFSIDNFVGTAEAHDGTPAVEWFQLQFLFDDLRASFSNDLYSLEFNLRGPLCDSGRWRGFAGFRWIELWEQFALEVTIADPPPPFAGPATNVGRLTLNNHLYGFQLGAEGVLWRPRPRLWFQGSCKAGIYGNHADRLFHIEGDLQNQHTAADESRLAFVSEIALMAVYKPCCNMKLFVGYEGLHLKDVAIAKVQDEADTIVIFDDAFYYGFLAGVEVSLGKRRCCPGPCESCASG